jgi:hypothetical protein
VLEIVLGLTVARRRAVVIADTPGSNSAAVAGALTACAVSCRRLVFFAPPQTASREAISRWHRDLWSTVSPSDRRRILLVAGDTAQYLAPLIGDETRIVAFVDEPVEASLALGLKSRQLEEAVQNNGRRTRRIAYQLNAQSRALLGPWHDTDGFPVSDGPPGDADRWREALFGDVLTRVAAVPAEAAVERAGSIAKSLKWMDKQVARYLRTVGEPRALKLSEPTREHVASFCWLDGELRTEVGNGVLSPPGSL